MKSEKIIIENFSDEELRIMLPRSHIYWIDKTKICGELADMDWDKSIEYHEKLNSSIELIKYCKYGKCLQYTMLPNVKPGITCYEELLLLINSFMEDQLDCLVKSKIIMAYIMVKYWIWECDFSIIYKDGIMKIFDMCIMIDLNEKSLSDMNQVFHVEAYDDNDGIVNLDD